MGCGVKLEAFIEAWCTRLSRNPIFAGSGFPSRVRFEADWRKGTGAARWGSGVSGRETGSSYRSEERRGRGGHARGPGCWAESELGRGGGSWPGERGEIEMGRGHWPRPRSGWLLSPLFLFLLCFLF